jgi:hypothetical protein
MQRIEVNPVVTQKVRVAMLGLVEALDGIEPEEARRQIESLTRHLETLKMLGRVKPGDSY